MIRAAEVMDALFLEQIWGGNEAMLFDLLRDESPAGKERLQVHGFPQQPGLDVRRFQRDAHFFVSHAGTSWIDQDAREPRKSLARVRV